MTNETRNKINSYIANFDGHCRIITDTAVLSKSKDGSRAIIKATVSCSYSDELEQMFIACNGDSVTDFFTIDRAEDFVGC